MKKFYLLLSLTVFVIHVKAQNSNPWPTSGNVGIGTTTPASSLVVNNSDGSATGGRVASFADNVAITTSATIGVGGNRAQFGYNGTSNNAVIQGGGSKGIEFNVNGAFGSGQAMVISSDGKVGIGTTSPAYLFDIQKAGSGSAGAYGAIEGFSNDASAGAYLRLVKSRGVLGAYNVTSSNDALGVIDFLGVTQSSSPNVGARIIAYQNGTATTTNVPGRLAFFTTDGTAGSTEKATITASGNMGIGTSTPAYPFTIAGTAGQMASFGDNLATTDQAYASFGGPRAFFGYDGVNANAVVQSGSGNKGIEFNTGSTTFGTNTKMYIASTGNVGIGTTTPSSTLDVNGNVSVESAAGQIASFGGNLTATDQAYASFGGPRAFFGYDGASANAVVQSGAGDKGIEFNTGTTTFGTNTKMLLTGSGSVGIGTVNPDSKLSVVGTIHAQEVLVDMNQVPDYVFAEDYKLPSLKEVKAYVQANHHLAEIPSAKEIEANGLKLGEMNKLLLKKVEELTLYAIDKDDDTQKQKELITNQQNQLTAQQAQIDELKSQLQQLIKSTPAKN